jgi:hypothetical protein
MDGFKNSTKTKYMCGGPVKKATGGVVKKAGGGGVYNERGKRATWDEVAAEGRRVENEKAARAAARRPVEGISTRPTDSSGRRMTDKELGMTPGGVSPAKKMMPKGVGAMSDREMQMLKAKETARKAIPRGMGAMSDREMQMLKAKETARKAVPAHSSKPMIRRKTGGLTAMPKGKC